MQTLEDYQARFQAYEQVRFWRTEGGLIMLELVADDVCARFCLQGAQLLQLRFRGQPPVFWLSGKAFDHPGRAIRGGLPLCWPWFGPADTPDRPAHGFARNVPWRLTGLWPEEHAWIVRFQLSDSADTRALWPHSFEASLTFQLGASMRVDFCVVNLDSVPMSMSYAFHGYFPVSDVAHASLTGLDGRPYIDKLLGRSDLLQQGPLRVLQACDSVFPDAGGEYSLRDSLTGSELLIQSEHCASAVVWNPWREKAASLEDMDAEAFRQMICVECGNVASSGILIAAGEAHTSAVTIRYRCPPVFPAPSPLGQRPSDS